MVSERNLTCEDPIAGGTIEDTTDISKFSYSFFVLKNLKYSEIKL